MEKIGKSLKSTIRMDRGFAFSRAQDRFKAAAMRINVPSPQAYKLGDSVGHSRDKESSPFKTRGASRTIFGKEDRSK